MKYGVDNESLAMEKYQSQKAVVGGNVEVTECGWFVALDFWQLAASHDRLVSDEYVKEKHGLVEVKCLYLCKDLSRQEAALNKGTMCQFPLKTNRRVYLSKRKSFLLLSIAKRKWCDFVLF